MNAMVLDTPNKPLVYKRVQVPKPVTGQVLVKIIACGICRTDLHITDGELKNPKLPLIPGHEIVGVVVKNGANSKKFHLGDEIGIPWVAYTCGKCKYCSRGDENLCENALFTGYTINGGYAEYTVADERYCFHVSDHYAKPGGAPLLCAGLIGFRSYQMAGENIQSLGIYGFGAAAHILIQLAKYQDKKVYAFTRDGDIATQDFARKLGAAWSGGSSDNPPEILDAAIIFAPVGELVPKALMAVDKGGIVVCGGIHMSDIPSFPYSILWEERKLVSVANLTKKDAEDFLKIAPEIPIKTEITVFSLNQANEALEAVRIGKIRGAAVLKIGERQKRN